MREPTTYNSTLEITLCGRNKLQQTLSFDQENNQQTITSIGDIDGSILRFDAGNLPRQILLLADGASSNTPMKIKSGQPFFLELGWLINPQQRQRIIRSYGAKGEWLSLTLVKEKKISP